MRYWFKHDILTTTERTLVIYVYNNGKLEPLKNNTAWIPWSNVIPRLECKEIIKDPYKTMEYPVKLPKNKYICVDFTTYKERTNMSDPNPDNHKSKKVCSKTKRYWFFNRESK